LGIIKFGGCILTKGKKVGKKKEKKEKEAHEFWRKWILKEKMGLRSLIALQPCVTRNMSG
jgi:hypothetical protein